MLAPDETFRNSWVKALVKAIQDAKVAEGIPAGNGDGLAGGGGGGSGGGGGGPLS